MGIAVKESPEFVLEFGELLFAWVTLIPFDVVVQNVDSFRFEELSDFSVLVNHISDPHLLDVGVDAFVSESGVEHG